MNLNSTDKHVLRFSWTQRERVPVNVCFMYTIYIPSVQTEITHKLIFFEIPRIFYTHVKTYLSIGQLHCTWYKNKVRQLPMETKIIFAINLISQYSKIHLKRNPKYYTWSPSRTKPRNQWHNRFLAVDTLFEIGTAIIKVIL